MSTRKRAVVNCGDTGPYNSLRTMLEAAGYDCYVPDTRLSIQLSTIGGLVLSNQQLVQTMGYEPIQGLKYVSDLKDIDLYVDVKAHQTYDKLVRRWPNLVNRVLWYRINGGQPEHVVRKCDRCHGHKTLEHSTTGIERPCPDCNGTGVGENCGDEINPPCPVLTPNQWYKDTPWVDRTYSFWPSYDQLDTAPTRPVHTDPNKYDRPVCLIHNVNGWGYRDLVEPVRALGVRVFGRGSPDGLIPRKEVPTYLQHAIAYVHLKSNDAPGYALYEAIAAGCPIILPRRLVWRCRMQELFEPWETYLPFDSETHDALSAEDVKFCTDEIQTALNKIHNQPVVGKRIATNAHNRLRNLMWNAQRDGDSFREFMGRNFQ